MASQEKLVTKQVPPSHTKEALAKYKRENPERSRASSARYREKNREKIKERRAAYRTENKEKIAASMAIYRERNAAKIAPVTAKWSAENLDKRRLYASNRRAAKADAGGKLSRDLPERLFRLQKGLCACCREPLGSGFHLDHIMPLALGGRHEDSNMQLLRKRCNHQKCAKHPVDFMRERGFLL